MSEPTTRQCDLGGIRARQYGRKSEYGPQPGQQSVSAVAFLIARNDIDDLLGELERLRTALNTILMQANKGHAAMHDEVRTDLVERLYYAEGTFAHIRDTAEAARAVKVTP